MRVRAVAAMACVMESRSAKSQCALVQFALFFLRAVCIVLLRFAEHFSDAMTARNSAQAPNAFVFMCDGRGHHPPLAPEGAAAAYSGLCADPNESSHRGMRV